MIVNGSSGKRILLSPSSYTMNMEKQHYLWSIILIHPTIYRTAPQIFVAFFPFPDDTAIESPAVHFHHSIRSADFEYGLKARSVDSVA